MEPTTGAQVALIGIAVIMANSEAITTRRAPESAAHQVACRPAWWQNENVCRENAP